MTNHSSRDIDPDRYRSTVTRLSADDMEGRRVGTPGGQEAIRFMESLFREAGLLPPGSRTSYVQRYRHTYRGIASAANVVGVLPGNDPELKHQVVIVSAHHDHLGRNRSDGCPKGRRGIRVKHGANDNASGSAALVELASAFAGRRHELKRTVLFLSTDGEECGCTGVKHYVFEDPIFPLEDTVYALNIDQIGEGGWLVDHTADTGAPDEADCNVDGEVFARRRVKAQTLVGDNQHYHRSTDVISNMNFAKALETVHRAYELVWNAAQEDLSAY